MDNKILEDIFEQEDLILADKVRQEIWDRLRKRSNSTPIKLQNKLCKITIPICQEIVKDKSGYEPGSEGDVKLATLYHCFLSEMKRGEVIHNFEFSNPYTNPRDELDPPQAILVTKIKFFPNKILKAGEILNESEKNKLYLDKSDNLFRNPKEKYSYPLNGKSKRLKVIKYFIKNILNDFYPTSEIANELGYANNANLSKELGKINKEISQKLSLKDNIFQGKKGNGYRINPKYKISYIDD